MTNIIFCTKLKKEAEALDKAPIPGPLGQKIHQEISKDAWNEWVNLQTMLINEHRLNLIDKKSRAFLLQEMQNFLFGDGAAKPEGYIPEK
jgi:Fe-S cluster biosynthesis and repair protein YggX